MVVGVVVGGVEARGTVYFGLCLEGRVDKVG